MITGGAGFVGRHLTTAILSRWPGAEVVWFSRDEGVSDSKEAWPIAVKSHVADLCNAASVDEAMREIRPAIVLHLAAQSSVAQAGRAAHETWRTNFLGSFHLAESVASHAPEASLIFASTANVYGLSFNNGNANEDTLPQPRDVYSRSKLAAEAMLSDVLSQQTRLIILRPTNHTGPGHDERFALPSFAAQIARIELGLAPPVLNIGNLDVERDFLDIGDAIKAYISILDNLSQLPMRATYNVGSGQPINMKNLVDKMVKLARVPVEVRVDPSRFRSDEVPSQSVGFDKLHAATSWKPTQSMDHTIVQLIEYWREQISRR